MDDAADAHTAGQDDDAGVLGRLPAHRPQHRSARRTAGPRRATSGGSRPRPTASTAPRAAGPATPSAALRAAAREARVPAPPAAPRSGWATPEPERSATAMPPLVAVVDGTLRSVEQLVRRALRRLPFR